MNRLTNAGALDGASGWTRFPAGLNLRVDEADRGAPGRIVLKADGASAAPGQAFGVATAANAAADIRDAPVVEVSAAAAAFINGAAVAPFVRVRFVDEAGDTVMSYDLQVRRPVLERWGVAREGLRDTYFTAWARLPRPTLAVAAILEAGAVAQAAGQHVEAVLLKPMVAVPPAGLSHPLLWSPGLHSAPDLQRAAWPGWLREIEVGATFEPKAGRIEFDAGPGRPMSRPIASDPARKLAGRIRGDVVQRAALEAFAAGANGFWMVEPGSERLCVASWAADGAPRLSETRGALHLMDFTLWLETA
ncbi:hypothetical protein [Brevundimonas vancanneytii]|uniref:Uncharacterized protein n=1 Tax=Brevundimonas vancanneytii TaxID=1325724 RepID=A0A4P1JRD7_9CAUL|nr:hypothetical protein [Brevundimonas vancanneytii]VTO10697.1 Uncharacterised protein [Brevundimonas vancanneytii]